MAALSGSAARGDETINFEGIQAGTIVSQVFSDGGFGPISVLGTRNRPGNHAIIFDSANPTGGDIDLGTPNQGFGGPGVGVGGQPGSPYQNDTALGKILIMADNLTDANSDGLVDNPNDYNGPGILQLDFTAIGPVVVSGLNTLIDIEIGQVPTIEFFDMNGISLGAQNLPSTGNNGVAHVTFDPAVTGVGKIQINLNGSGAIDNFAFNFGGPDCDSDGTADSQEADTDSDGTIDDCEACPSDPNKLDPGLCGCGNPDVDCDSNGVCDATEGPDCDSDGVLDACESDADSDGAIDDCDGCPQDASKTAPGLCGCGNTDVDCNGNQVCDTTETGPDCNSNQIPDGCEPDSDQDGVIDACDGCPQDRNKTAPGICGCGRVDADCDSNGVCDTQQVNPDCNHNSVLDACESDVDRDGTIDACDGCPNDPRKTSRGVCGCGNPEADCNRNGRCDSDDIRGCRSRDCNSNGVPDECEPDTDRDGTIDGCDQCPNDRNKTRPGLCGCGNRDNDCNRNRVCDSEDIRTGRSHDCNNNGTPDECECLRDGDRDGTPDACDGCPSDCNKTAPGLCGCGKPDRDCNHNGVCDTDDIRGGRSRDCDRNGVPDECQTDRDGDGTIDPCDRYPGDRRRC